MRRICFVTGSRAEYGLLRWIMEEIRQDSELDLQLVVTGMHLSREFGFTYEEIEEDGFKIDRKIEILTSSDTSVDIAKSMGIAMIGFANAFNELRPDLIVVLGDRFEIFSAASVALILCIPVAHIHGGETTEGAFDESLRHAITKMSHLHFVANESYRQRVIQLGEQPNQVFLVGGLGVDAIKRLNLLTRPELEDSLDFKLGKKSLLITYHPETLDAPSAEKQMEELLAALAILKDTQLIFTLPNSDTNSRILIKMIQEFVSHHKNARAYNSLGQLKYLSCISQVDAVVGNSSSGLSEVPSFKKGTINIGDRQGGRLQAISVINCEPTRKSISNAFAKLYSFDFQSSLPDVINPYGEGGASEKIASIIKNYPLNGLVKKFFYNLPSNNFIERT